MGAQLALEYPASYVGGEVWRQRLDVIRLAVKYIGLKEVAFTLDVAGSLLSDSLNERDRKRWAGEWLDTLKAMLVQKHDEIALDLLRQLCELDVSGTPFALVADEPLTPEEEAAALRRELAKFGDAGKAAVDRIRKRGRR